MLPKQNRQVRLKARPEGIPEAHHFEIAAAPLPEIGEGQFVVRNRYLSVERDLLIRKLFTAGLDTASVSGSLLSVTIGMLKSIWAARTSLPANMPQPHVLETGPVEKLPAETLVVRPLAQTTRLAELAEERRTLAA